MNVRTLCLGILYFGEATGYEIRKTASEGGFSHFIEANYGSIYPALTKLTQDELVTMREEVVSGKPSRKVYALTDQGREALKAALNEPLRADIFKSEFLFLSLYADLLGTERLTEIMKQRRADLRNELTRLHDAMGQCDHPGSNFAIGYGIALTEAALSYMATHAASASGLQVEPARAAE